MVIIIIAVVIAVLIAAECVFFLPDKMPWNKKKYEKKEERWWENE